jgi:AcrR family transcriptional regulator
MSQGTQVSDTRLAILRAARDLMTERGYHGVGLDVIARAAGVSRQAVYLHFGSKAGLFLSLVDWVDQSEELALLHRRVDEADDAVQALDRLVELHARYDPRILPLALVFESARRVDPAARTAWEDRMQSRHIAFRQVVRRLAREGRLADGLSVQTATDLLWALCSIQTCEQLRIARGWSQQRYERHVKRAARRLATNSP